MTELKCTSCGSTILKWDRYNWVFASGEIVTPHFPTVICPNCCEEVPITPTRDEMRSKEATP